MSNTNQTAIQPTRAQDYNAWYQEIIKAADLADNSPVRGCMVIKPWGYAIWERIQASLDQMFKDTGHVNAYFPLFIPLSYLEKEAQHVSGFAKECAVVTHHRLESDGKGGLKPAAPLEEPLIVRPTSETIIGEMYAKWVQSYRDLPILINQWANVVRWEMRTRIFLRTSEFLWQEGHTVHATAQEAQEETLKMLRVYEDFAQNFMAMPVICGEKTAGERFPGAVSTYSIEAMMQDGKALQAGTSHFLGQNFAKASNIQFLDKNGDRVHAWTTSWGVSTRLIGGLIMTHSDDNGLVLPPKLAPEQIVISPIYKNDSERASVLDYCQKLKTALIKQYYADVKLRVLIDDRDLRGGEKNWQNIKRGIPIRIEVGPRDLEKNAMMVARRDQDPKLKNSMGFDDFINKAVETLDEIQNNLFTKALKFREENTVKINNLKDFKDYFAADNNQSKNIPSGFAKVFCHSDADIKEILSEYKITPRCLPIDSESKSGTGSCIFSQKKDAKEVIFARAY